MHEEEFYINELLSCFFPSGSWTVHIGASGMNNMTRFVEANNKKYVLRIYETHQDAAKVLYEHSVLCALQALPLTFCIPKPVRTSEGDTIIRTKDGKLAALFYFLNGTNPSLTTLQQLYSFGQAAGHLTKALEGLCITQEPVYRPYYEIENTHPRCSLQDAIHFCTHPSLEFEEDAFALLDIQKQLISIQNAIPQLKLLPHQLIHGDLNASNILINEKDNVSAILDFEFITNDLRVMELAVCLSDIIGSVHDDAMLWNKLDAFLSGYGSTLQLTADEIHVIPFLIQLRRLDVFIHFLGRYWDKVDKKDTLKDQIHKTTARTHWLNINSHNLIMMCASHVSTGTI